jgi:hypothetical protein
MSLLDTASLIVTPNGYKEGKLYSVIPSDGSGDMSVVRATTATRVNSAGLVELVPYNLLEQSNSFNGSPWTAVATITPNATTAPDGTMTATRVQLASGGISYLYQGVSFSSGAKTISCYIKGATAQTIGFNDGNANPNSINITTEWQRYTFTFNSSGGGMGIQFDNYYGVSPSQEAKDFYIWGAQFVEGSTAKDYQKTETRLNIPRLDYSNGTCPSLLVEPQRTNLALYSSSFDNAAWEKLETGSGSTIPIVTSNYAISPDGTQNASRLQCTLGASGYSLIQQGFIVGGTHTGSIWVKSNTSSNQNIYFRVSSNTTAYVVTPNWTRIDSTESAGDYLTIGLRDVTGYTNYSCDISIWGAQLEAGNYSTSYIPTTSASVTRNADVISKTGISSLIGQTEGTLFFDSYVTITGDSSSYAGILLNNGTSSNVIAVGYYQDGRIQAAVFVSGSLLVNIDLPSFGLTNGKHKFALAYKLNDYVFYVDGIEVGSDTSATVPATSVFNLSDLFGGANISHNAVALWQTRLDNATLASLTTL